MAKVTEVRSHGQESQGRRCIEVWKDADRRACQENQTTGNTRPVSNSSKHLLSAYCISRAC